MTDRLSASEALALLVWQQSAGVDAALRETPLDWLQRGNRPPNHGYTWPQRSRSELAEERPSRNDEAASAPAAAPLVRPRPATPLAASEAETEARRAAQGAASLEQLEAALRAFDGCNLKATATNLCFYRGAAQSKLMLIGEAPGRDEDLAGKPFVGRAGQLLDKMLAAIGLSEADVHITNVVYWRPPGNRTPTPQETLACRPFLERQIDLVAPDIIVALGGSAAKEVLGAAEGIMRLRGKWRTAALGARGVQAIATLHPAYLLRAPAAKQLVWLDLLNIKSKLNSAD